MLMRDNFLLLFSKRPQVRTMYAWLCSDLACVSNSQSSCVVVEKWLHCVVLLHDKLFSASMTMLLIVTNFFLATVYDKNFAKGKFSPISPVDVNGEKFFVKCCLPLWILTRWIFLFAYNYSIRNFNTCARIHVLTAVSNSLSLLSRCQSSSISALQLEICPILRGPCHVNCRLPR